MDIWPLLPPLALGLDALLGDPRGWPHPVRYIGLALDKAEKMARAWAAKAAAAKDAAAKAAAASGAERHRLRLAGAIVALLVAGGGGGLVYFFCALPGLGFFIALYFAYAGLALRGLIEEVDRARGEIFVYGLKAGRAAVAGLVSRDVAEADEDDLYRALAETLAENFNDGVVAPFFWLCLGGPAGLWAYKAISTMDSMWGYKTEGWRDLGMAGARADDVMAWLPARISALILRVFSGKSGSVAGPWPGWVIIAAQARKMASPNSGWPMSVAAWLQGRAMGGPTRYHGETVEKPRLGPEKALSWDNDSLLALLTRVRRAGLLGCLALWAFFGVIRALLAYWT